MEALKMESQMGNWNDGRLDELSRRVDGGFTRVDHRFERLEGEMKDGLVKLATKEELGEVKGDLGEIKVELRYLGERFDRLSHALLVAALSFGIAVLTALGGFIVSQA